MSRLIRIDDFPHGDKNLFYNFHENYYRQIIKPAIDIFEKNKIDYILGVTPGLLLDGDLEFLNENISYGNIVMHGFNHGWHKNWDTIIDSWEKGGEFEGQSELEISNNYEEGFSILSKLNKFNKKHYIPPFNAYNQSLLNVLNKTDVEVIHTCDKEYNSFNLQKLNYFNLKLEISEYGKTYSMCDNVLKNLENKSQITLHWIYRS